MLIHQFSENDIDYYDKKHGVDVMVLDTDMLQYHKGMKLPVYLIDVKTQAKKHTQSISYVPFHQTPAGQQINFAHAVKVDITRDINHHLTSHPHLLSLLQQRATE